MYVTVQGCFNFAGWWAQFVWTQYASPSRITAKILSTSKIATLSLCWRRLRWGLPESTTKLFFQSQLQSSQCPPGVSCSPAVIHFYRKTTFKNYEERSPAADKMCHEAELLTQLFGKLAPKTQVRESSLVINVVLSAAQFTSIVEPC